MAFIKFATRDDIFLDLTVDLQPQTNANCGNQVIGFQRAVYSPVFIYYVSTKFSNCLPKDSSVFTDGTNVRITPLSG